MVEAQDNSTAALTSQEVGAVLHFWFEELSPKQWFAKDDAVDAQIRARFADLHARLEAAMQVPTPSEAKAALATVIVLDQFPRNLHRGDARAFATDDKARHITNDIVAREGDRGLGLHERVFLYLPLEHSEALADQERAVELISALGDETYTRYAIAHRDVIQRFGRFPHRNAALGRDDTREEKAYLAEPGAGF
ncbi:MAG: DUF924 domain-containing protein [Neomegalonema sp.]|nr:DUF924 domain-containing protein [Neomegalonema sp.]